MSIDPIDCMNIVGLRTALEFHRFVDTSPTTRPSRTLFHTPTPSASPPLALHEVPTRTAGPPDRLLGQLRHGGVERHERFDRLFGIAVPD